MLSGAVDMYFIQCGNLAHVIDVQLAILMLRNSNLTNDTLNGLTFKLTAMLTTIAETEPCVSISRELVNKVMCALEDGEVSAVECINIVKSLRRMSRRRSKERKE